jgi:hypothetical protein
LNLTPVAPSLDERHTIAITKRDVGVVVHALATLHTAHAKEKRPKQELDKIKDLHAFFSNVYTSQGVL